MRILNLSSGLLVGALISNLTHAHAQGPQRSTATYDDWTLVCIMPSEGRKSCEIVHTQVAQGQSEPVGQVAISRPAKDQPTKIFLQVPPNVWLQNGATFVFDDKVPGLIATFQWCAPSRCLAEADLPTAAIAKMRARTEPGKVEYKEATQRDVSTPVSFKGFAAALDAMEKQ
jgi:invasion protein IalB